MPLPALVGLSCVCFPRFWSRKTSFLAWPHGPVCTFCRVGWPSSGFLSLPIHGVVVPRGALWH